MLGAKVPNTRALAPLPLSSAMDNFSVRNDSDVFRIVFHFVTDKKIKKIKSYSIM